MALIYNIFLKLYEMFWKRVAKGDSKRLSETKFPEGVDFENYKYGEDDDPYHTYSIYFLKDKDITKLPILIDIHGGGWGYGTKETNKPFCMYLASKGIVVMTMSYRLIPKVTTPVQFKDIIDSINSFSNVAREKCLNSNNIFLTGDSAGGFFSMCIESLKEKNLLNEYIGSTLDIDFKGIILNHPAFDFDLMKKQGFYYPMLYRTMFGKEYEEDKIFKALKNTETIIDGMDHSMPYLFITSLGDSMLGKSNEKVMAMMKEKFKSIEIINNEKKPDCHVYNVMFINSESGKETNDQIARFISENMD